MRSIRRVLLMAVGAAGLLGVTVTTGNAESPDGSSETQDISGNVDSVTIGGDNRSSSETEQNGGPTGEIEKTGLKRNDANTTGDGPSLKPGYHEWIERWNDCEKKDQLERQHR